MIVNSKIQASSQLAISSNPLSAQPFSWIRKRDGRIVEFDVSKISEAIFKAAEAVGGDDCDLAIEKIYAISPSPIGVHQISAFYCLNKAWIKVGASFGKRNSYNSIKIHPLHAVEP